MPSSFDDDVKRHRARLDAEAAGKIPKHQKPKHRSRSTLVSLGRSELLGEELTLDEEIRLRHSHTIGTTGSGKTNYLAHIIKQDINRGRGVMLLDPHGGDPYSPLASESLFSTIVAHCDRMGLIAAGRVHIIDPARSSHAIGFNPLTPRAGFAPDVIADAMIQCVERVWKEDTHKTPTTRATLRATLIALSELGLTLNETHQLLTHDDASGLRRYAITAIKSEYARRVLEEIQRLSEMRNETQFVIATTGPTNRINEFTSNDAIKAIVGQTTHLLDLVELMDQGHVLLVNLQSTGAAMDSPMRLLGTMLLRYLLALAPRRTNKVPFFVYIDECQNFLSGDIPALLREVRKRRIGMHLAHQDVQALLDAGDDIKGAIFNNTAVKTIFAMTDAAEARDVVDRFMPNIDYERPVQILIKPTVVGQEIVWLESESTGRQASETTAEGETQGASQARARGQAEQFGEMESSTDMTSESTMDATGFADMTGFVSSAGVSQSILPDPSLFGASMPSTIGTPTPGTLSLTASRGDSQSGGSSRNDMSGTSRGSAHADSYGRSYARSFSLVDIEGFSRALSKSRAHSEGTSTSQGRSQALMPIYKDLPTAVHSRDTIFDMIARTIISMQPGEAFVIVPGQATRIKVPHIKTTDLKPSALASIITRAFTSSRYTTPADQIDAAASLRIQDLLKRAAPATLKVKDEPDITAPDFWDEFKDEIPVYPDPPPQPKPKPATKTTTPKKPKLSLVNKDNDDEPPPTGKK